MLFGCHGAANQNFSASFLSKDHSDVIQVGGFKTGSNCLDYNYYTDFAYVFNCHGMANQRWAITEKSEFRVSSGKCLEYGLSDQVFVRDCTGDAEQACVYHEDGHIQSKALAKCLDASGTANGKFVLANCASDRASQIFRSDALKTLSKDVTKVAGPWADGQNCIDYSWGTELAYIYSCHGPANQQWELMADRQLRTADNMCLEVDAATKTRVLVHTATL